MKTLAIFILALGFAAQSTASNADCNEMSQIRLTENSNQVVKSKGSSGIVNTQPLTRGNSKK